MGKTLNRDERKNSRYTDRDEKRAQKMKNFSIKEETKKPSQKQKWRPHSEIEFD